MLPAYSHAALLFAQENGIPSLLTGPILPFVVIGLMFYVLLVLPERRKRAKTNEMLSNLKKNDHVVTVGGIHGVVVNAAKDSNEVTLRVDENTNTRLRILRSAITQVLTEGDESSESD